MPTNIQKYEITTPEHVLLTDKLVLHIVEPLRKNMEHAMGIILANLSTEASMQLKKRQEGAAIHKVVIPNCLIKPLKGKQIIINGIAMTTDLPMTTLERQLILDIGALRAPSIEADGVIDFQMLKTKFKDNCYVFELARLGPYARDFYQTIYEHFIKLCLNDIAMTTA